MANQEDLGRIMTAEQGKPFAEAKGEVAYGASFVEWFAEEAKRVNGETLPQFDNNRRLMVIRQPIGVCAAITPWNFPLAMITRKVAPALAAGCPVVIKPAELTPLTALAAAELAIRAGIPAGVLNLLTADGRQQHRRGQGVLRQRHGAPHQLHRLDRGRPHPDGAKRADGQEARRSNWAATRPSSCSTTPTSIRPSKAPWPASTATPARPASAPTASTCRKACTTSSSRSSRPRSKALKVGNGFEEGVVQGPLIEDAAVEKVERHVADALAKGGKVVVGGAKLKGQFFQPTVISDATASMLCAREETFGPLAPVFKFKTEQEAIAAANNTEFGLASYFYSRDVGRIFRVSEALEYGMVGINVGIIATEHVPFGGVKQSGLGREGSSHGMDEYLEMKYLCLGDILK